jgi:hypothetical protein
MSKRSQIATMVIVVLALSACGGGSDSAGTTDPPITGQAPATEPVTEPTTNPPATDETVSSTSTTTTEPAPTTTEPSIEDQVRAASTAAYNLYWECLRAPADCPIASWNLPGSDAFNAQTNTIADLVEGGLYVGAEDYGYMVVESIEIKDDHTAVTSCWYLTGVLYFHPPVEGAEPTIVNNTPGWGRQIDEFVQDPADGVWKIRRSDVGVQGANTNECPPEGT